MSNNRKKTEADYGCSLVSVDLTVGSTVSQIGYFTKRVVPSLADFFAFEFVSETLALVSKAGDLRSQKFLVLLSHVTDTHRHTF